MEKTKKSNGLKHTGLIFIGIFLCTAALTADIKLPAVLGDHMVLQQDKPIKIWGWAEPGEGISVTFADLRAQTTVDSEGLWEVRLKAMKAGGEPYNMTITCTQSQPLVLDDIWIGEVWICSG